MARASKSLAAAETPAAATKKSPPSHRLDSEEMLYGPGNRAAGDTHAAGALDSNDPLLPVGASRDSVDLADGHHVRRRDGAAGTSTRGSRASLAGCAADAISDPDDRDDNDDNDDHGHGAKAGQQQSYILGVIPRKDAFNIVVLVLLYLLQGVPVGLAFGTLPFLLKQKLSYSDMAIFSFAGYPYSLKLLWSPIVDSVYSRRLGRRKSWIVPMQILAGIMFYIMSPIMATVLEAETVNVYWITALWFFVIFLCATQDIAVDGWALTLLSRENVEFGSTCQTIGINTGYFASFTIFLALNSSDFCNKFLRSEPQPQGLVSLPGYIKFWAYGYFVLTVFLLLFKSEKPEKSVKKILISTTVNQIINVLKLPHVVELVSVLLLAKFAFVANDSVTALKLLDKGIQKEDLALSVLIDFPLQLMFGYVAAQWSSGPRPLRPWLLSWVGRLFFTALGPLIVYLCPADGKISISYFIVVIVTTVLTSFTSTVQFVCICAFFSKIADPVIGGTYMTLLNTIANLGGMWPKFFVLEAVEYLTVSKCSVPDVASGTCSTEAEKSACIRAGGSCENQQDGYYIVSIISVVLGGLVFFYFIRPRILALESLPVSQWRISKRDI